MRSIVITLRRSASPKLAAVVNRWLWTKQNNAAYILPLFHIYFLEYGYLFLRAQTDLSITTRIKNVGKSGQIFENNVLILDLIDLMVCLIICVCKLISVGLIISDDIDDEFIDSRLDRWLAEPVGVFLIEASAFITGEDPTEVDLCP